jgi:hypothetical protein
MCARICIRIARALPALTGRTYGRIASASALRIQAANCVGIAIDDHEA